MTSSTVVPIGLKLSMDDRMKVALDAMPVAVTWTRLDDGRVEFTNRRYVEMLGYDAADFPDVFGMIDATFADPARAEFAKAALRRVIGQNLLQGLEYQPEEVRVIARNGTALVTSFSGVVLPDANMSLATFVDITKTKKQEEQLGRLARQDPLTGLLNRRSFDESVEQAIAAKQAFGVVVLDLDGFKAVNDGLGHDAGDQVLQRFAQLLKSVVRARDLVCRWGGDEFAVLLLSPVSREDITGVISRLKEGLRQPVQLMGSTLTFGASAGSAIYPQDGASSLELWRVADTAMFEDKRRPGHQSR